MWCDGCYDSFVRVIIMFSFVGIECVTCEESAANTRVLVFQAAVVTALLCIVSAHLVHDSVVVTKG